MTRNVGTATMEVVVFVLPPPPPPHPHPPHVPRNALPRNSPNRPILPIANTTPRPDDDDDGRCANNAQYIDNAQQIANADDIHASR